MTIQVAFVAKIESLDLSWLSAIQLRIGYFDTLFLKF